MELKNLQDSLVELLLKFDTLCQSEHIEYTLHGGGLLGAIRNKGFIPWDDDLDVTMTRASYEKFCSCLERLDSEYYICGKVKTQFCVKGDSNIWIDIFICDYISENKVSQNIKLALLTVLDVMLRDEKSVKYSELEKYSKSKQICFKFVYYIGKVIPKKAKQNTYTFISQNLLCGSKRYHIRSNDKYVGRKIIMPVEWMSEFIRVPFEGYDLPVIRDYDALLRSSYGDNYMTPIQDPRQETFHNYYREVNKA